MAKNSKAVETPAAGTDGQPSAATPAPGEAPVAQSAKVETPDDLKSSVAASLENAPKPNEEAIAGRAAREQAEASAAANEPVKKKRGPYNKEGKKPAPGFVAPGQGPDAKKEAYRKSGRAMADTLILVGQTLGGEDWKPVLHKDVNGVTLYDERETLREAWADMAEEYEISKMPAWAACAIATAAYIGPRLNAPSTISRWEKVKLWWQARKIAKADKEAAKQKEKENHA